MHRRTSAHIAGTVDPMKMGRRILAHIETPFEPTNAYEDFGPISYPTRTHKGIGRH